MREGGRILITASGLDKGTLTPAGLLEVDLDGRVLAGDGKPSAETGLHLVLYRARPEAGAILHVHTVWNTLLSARFAARGYVPIEGYEIAEGALRGDDACASGAGSDPRELAGLCGVWPRSWRERWRQTRSAHGVLLSRHGLYTWGQSVAEARRHLEALEFLFEVEERRLLGGQPETLDRSLEERVSPSHQLFEEHPWQVLRFPLRKIADSTTSRRFARRSPRWASTTSAGT